MPNKKANSLSRRKFVQNGLLLGAGITILPRHVLGRGHIAPSDKLNIAGIGAGGKGESDLFEFSKSPKVNIAYLCDVDERASVKSRETFPKAKVYKDFREMLDKEKNNIDACSISTPDHTHAIATLYAMQMGKHVYTQKPLTYSIHEARVLTEAAKKYKVVTQMGNQGASGEGVRKTKEMCDAGLIGDIYEAHSWTNRPVWPQGLPTPSGDFSIPKELDWDLWLGPAKKMDYNPAYLPFNWRGWTQFGTGALGDMACHVLDPVFRILPILYPESVECSVAGVWQEMWNDSPNPDSFPPASIIHLVYPRTKGKGKIKLSWYDGGLLPARPPELLPEEPFGDWNGGVVLVGSKGKLLMDCYGENPRLLPSSRMKSIKMPKATIPRVPEGHYLQWVNACIAGHGNAQTSSPFEFAGPFTESVLIGNLAIRSWLMKNPKLKDWDDKYLGRKRLLWDAKNLKVTNFDEANQFVKREYREGWKLE